MPSAKGCRDRSRPSESSSRGWVGHQSPVTSQSLDAFWLEAEDLTAAEDTRMAGASEQTHKTGSGTGDGRGYPSSCSANPWAR